MLNSCYFTGRMASDPKLFQDNGVSRCVFTLAVDRDLKKEDGSYDTDFFDFICWRGPAEFVAENFRSGDLATVANARAQVHVYTDSAGEKQRKIEFLVDRVYFGYPRRSADKN